MKPAYPAPLALAIVALIALSGPERPRETLEAAAYIMLWNWGPALLPAK